MTLPSQTATLGAVFTRYAHNVIGGPEYKNQKYKKRPLLKLLNERKKTGGGGGQTITHPVNLGTSASGQSLSRNETFDITGNVNETWSTWSWAVVEEPCFVSWWDIRETQGNKNKMVTFLKSRIKETGENLEDNLATMLAASTAAETSDINPILSIVATSGASGGLNPATAGQTLWAAQNEDTINWSVEGIGRARTLKREITDRRGNTDMFLLPGPYFDETCEIGDSALVINQDAKTRGGTKYADLGLQVPFILGTPVIHDPAWDSAQTATGVAFDLDGCHLVVDPEWDMYMYPFEDMVYHGRLGQASVQIKVCQLTCSSRWTQGLLSTIS